jgi:hypothetical protein
MLIHTEIYRIYNAISTFLQLICTQGFVANFRLSKMGGIVLDAIGDTSWFAGLP